MSTVAPSTPSMAPRPPRWTFCSGHNGSRERDGRGHHHAASFPRAVEERSSRSTSILVAFLQKADSSRAPTRCSIPYRGIRKPYRTSASSASHYDAVSSVVGGEPERGERASACCPRRPSADPPPPPALHGDGGVVWIDTTMTTVSTRADDGCRDQQPPPRAWWAGCGDRPGRGGRDQRRRGPCRAS